MQQWAAIDIADALELLSPDFKNNEVRAHAVATLQVREDESSSAAGCLAGGWLMQRA
jgi:phosphatidylinositol 3-kinase